MSPRLTAWIAGFSLATAVIVGLDCIAIPTKSIRILGIIEQIAPPDWWGIYLITCAVVAVGGWAIKKWWLIILAHAALAGIYIAFGIGAFIGLVQTWEGHGWGTVTNALVLQAAIHVALTVAAWREWDRVRDRRDRLGG